MQLSVIQNRINTLVVTQNAKSGSTTARLMSQKEFGAAKSIKGAELKRQHKAYLRDNGALLSGVIAANATAGAIVAQKCRLTKSGDWHVLYTPKHKLEVKASDKVKAVQSAAESAAMEKAAAVLAEKLNCSMDEAKAYLK